MHPFTARVLMAIKAIPAGKVATYGHIALVCGNPRAARQVSRILSACSERHDLPWHRIVNRFGAISLPGDSGELQRALLRSEKVRFGRDGTIDLAKFHV